MSAARGRKEQTMSPVCFTTVLPNNTSGRMVAWHNNCLEMLSVMFASFQTTDFIWSELLYWFDILPSTLAGLFDHILKQFLSESWNHARLLPLDVWSSAPPDAMRLEGLRSHDFHSIHYRLPVALVAGNWKVDCNMARTFFIFIVLGLVTLAMLPNPENPRTSEWENIQKFEKPSPSLLDQGFDAIGINMPKELLPGFGIIGISMFLSLSKKTTYRWN